jgi:hypothetical protein
VDQGKLLGDLVLQLDLGLRPPVPDPRDELIDKGIITASQVRREIERLEGDRK